MSTVKPLKTKNTDYINILVLCLCVTAVFFVAWTFTGQWPWKSQPYNSYILQAQSWLEGRLDLGRDYPYLELAIFNNKYYVSFPPFPSYVMLPFVLIGWNSCDSMIAFAVSLLGAVYAFKILKHFDIESKTAIFFTLLLTVGSNWLMTAQNAWVWFIAQNMAFTLSLMAIYYALKNKIGLSLAFWACAVGCRPFQILYLPALLYLIYNAHKAVNPEDKIIDIIKKRYLALVPMAVIALSYMILNFARFGHITEFGHNYLPEFTRSELGQFNIGYMAENLKNMFSVPETQNGIWQYPYANGMCIFLVSPIFISYLVYIARSIIKHEKFDMKFMILVLAIAIIELLSITAHKTMGGAHFGNRYTNDVLPIIFIGTVMLLPKDNDWESFNYPLFFIGLAINLVGSIMFFVQ